MMLATQLHCIVEPVDMRRGIDGLSQWIQTNLCKSPCDGMAYALINRAKTRLKLLMWDGTGVWCCQRRLHRGSFVWPKAEDTCVELTRAQWDYLIKGVDWQRLSAEPQKDWRV